MPARIFAALALAIAVPVTASAETVSFPAADGGAVSAELVRAAGPPKATILLFHQAGSNHAEYAPVVPKLAALGYTTIAVDQRSGGDLFGGSNRTVAARHRSSGFLDALPDLEAALSFAKARDAGAPVVAWGSSYSASLVFYLAARHPDQVAAIFAFSPGEYFGDHQVHAEAARVRCPVFVTSASDPEEETEAQDLLDAVPATSKTRLVQSHGTHGASTLRADVDPAGADAAWAGVAGFLDALALKRSDGAR